MTLFHEESFKSDVPFIEKPKCLFCTVSSQRLNLPLTKGNQQVSQSIGIECIQTYTYTYYVHTHIYQIFLMQESPDKRKDIHFHYFAITMIYHLGS